MSEIELGESGEIGSRGKSFLAYELTAENAYFAARLGISCLENFYLGSAADQ